MRFDSAPSMSAFSLPRSVTRKRLVVRSRCPTTRSVAGSMSCSHRPGAGHEAQVGAEEGREEERGEDRAHARAQPRQQRRRGRRPRAGRRRASRRGPRSGATKKCSCSSEDTECARVVTGFICAEIGVTWLAPDAGGDRADEHDLVGVLGRGDLARVDVEERVDREGRAAVAVLVEVGEHLRLLVRAHDLVAERHALAAVHLDVLGAQVEAAGRDHHRERGELLAVVVDDERLGADRAVGGVGRGVEVADARPRWRRSARWAR